MAAPAPGGAHAIFGGSIDRVRVLVSRQDESTAADTTIAFSARDEELRAVVAVPLLQKVETLYVYVDLLAGQSSLWYASQQLVLRVGIVPSLPPLQLAYIGPGYDAISVAIQQRLVTVAPGGTVQLTAVAQDPFQGISASPIGWSVSDTRLASISATGLISARQATGTFHARAFTPTGLIDSIPVTITAALP